MFKGSFIATRFAIPLLALMSMAGTSAAAPADYNFQIVGQPTQTAAGTTITVRLTRVADGPVTDAHVYYQSAEPLNPKAWTGNGPRISMQPDRQGNYSVVVSGPIANGEPLHFVAEIPGSSSIASAPKAGATPAAAAVEATPGETVQWSVRFHKT